MNDLAEKLKIFKEAQKNLAPLLNVMRILKMAMLKIGKMV